MSRSTTIFAVKEYPELLAVIRAAFPSYRKHKVIVSVTDSVELAGTFWDGGSRSSYVAVELASNRSKGAPQYAPPQFGGPRVAPRVTLPVGVAIVECGTFQGKPATAHVFIHPDNATKFLPASAVAVRS